MQDKQIERWQRLNKFLPTVAKLLVKTKSLFLGDIKPKRTGKKWDAYRAKRRRANRAAHRARMITWKNR